MSGLVADHAGHRGVLPPCRRLVCFTAVVMQLAAADSPNGVVYDEGAALTGLRLLILQASAADPSRQPGWVKRRVEQLEFVDTRAVRWRVSVDFVVPEDAPRVRVGGSSLYLVPVTSMAKSSLVGFSLRDERSAAVWLPTSHETTQRLASALCLWAAQELNSVPEDLPDWLFKDLARIVQHMPREFRSQQPVLLVAAALIDAGQRRGHALAKRDQALAKRERALAGDVRWWDVRGRVVVWRRLRAAAKELAVADRALAQATRGLEKVPEAAREPALKLMRQEDFRSRVEELARNFIIHVGVTSPPGTRRILKLAYEREVTFALPRGWSHRLWQSLGWRCWQVGVLLGGRGGSHHLEVAAPPGVDIVGITADPLKDIDPADPAGRAGRARPIVSRAWWRQRIFWEPNAAVVIPGYRPHVHISPPDDASVRYRAAIYVRVSRPGWLTSSWLVSLAICGVIAAGLAKLNVVYSAAAGGEAGTAATLLLALLGVFATLLISPGAHPLAARLLRLARLLILADAAAVLVGVGDLVLHQAGGPLPVTVWTVLTVVTAVAAALLTASRLLPVDLRPHRTD